MPRGNAAGLSLGSNQRAGHLSKEKQKRELLLRNAPGTSEKQDQLADLVERKGQDRQIKWNKIHKILIINKKWNILHLLTFSNLTGGKRAICRE